jgi:amidase
MNDLTFQSATWLAAAIRRKDLSSREVIEAHLEQIERANPPLNAVVHVLAQTAREAARKADDAVARGDSLLPGKSRACLPPAARWDASLIFRSATPP